MGYDLSNRLVIGLASSALFDLDVSDKIFREEGEKEYRIYQNDNQDKVLDKGVAFPFIKRLLSLNNLNPEDPPVEVILLSRNDPYTGLRVMNSIEHYKLGITRAVFLKGNSPYKYIPSFDIELFLTANAEDVRNAVNICYPAGQVLKSTVHDDPEDKELRIAFDFDGVLVDDEAEKIYKENDNIDDFHTYEDNRMDIVHNPGPLKSFIDRIATIQAMEKQRQIDDPSYQPILKIFIVTARSAPAHKRVINTMKAWGIAVDEAFFLGGISKHKILEILRPHIFFDDQKLHLELSSNVSPSVHIPFGIANKQL